VICVDGACIASTAKAYDTYYLAVTSPGRHLEAIKAELQRLTSAVDCELKPTKDGTVVLCKIRVEHGTPLTPLLDAFIPAVRAMAGVTDVAFTDPDIPDAEV